MAIMTHIVAGYPTMKRCESIANLMLNAGVDLLEIQIPFSDPIADGPVIMQANQIALQNGTTPDDCFALMERLKQKSNIPMLFMTYYNIALRYGLKRFCKRAKDAGAYGLIIPDMPIDEEPGDHYLKTCRQYDLHAIQIISPISPVRRLKKLSKVSSGFVYCVARTGTTGTSKTVDHDLGQYLNKVRKYIASPLALGFGISNRKQVQQALQKADIAVIGSKIMIMAEKGKTEEIKKFLTAICS